MSFTLHTTSSTGVALGQCVANHILLGGTTAAISVRLVDGSATSDGTLRATFKARPGPINMPLGGLDFGTGLFVQSTAAYGGLTVLCQ